MKKRILIKDLLNNPEKYKKEIDELIKVFHLAIDNLTNFKDDVLIELDNFTEDFLENLMKPSNDLFSFNSIELNTIDGLLAIEEDNCFYRGQSNSNWPLLPIMFRENKHFNSEDVTIIDLLKQLNITKTEKEPFLELANLQHDGKEKTFLLDITSKILVAASFMCNENVNLEGAIFKIKPKSNSVVINDWIKANEYISNIKYKSTNIYDGDKVNIDLEQKLLGTNIDDIYSTGFSASPLVTIIDCKNMLSHFNDNIRIKRQYGSFAIYDFFYLGLSNQNKVIIYTNFKEQYEITKYLISSKLKKEIKNYIAANEHLYNINYLMEKM